MKDKPAEISVVAIFNPQEIPIPHMFKWNGKKYYVDRIAEKFEDCSKEGQYFVYRCYSNFGEDSHSIIEFVYEIRYFYEECRWVLQWIHRDA